MQLSACSSCGAEIDQPVKGRPRKYCSTCSPSKAASYRPAPRVDAVCFCGESFVAVGVRKYCSVRCRERAKSLRTKRVPCDQCGILVWIGGRRSASDPRCRACRAPKHGDVAMYQKRGCRCAECRGAVAAYNREYAARRRSVGRPVPRGGSWISRADRSYIYMRDDFICQLCGVRVDLDAHYMDDAAPTVDHIVPRALGGSDDLDNLRLACRACNASRGARVDWSPHGVQGRDAQVAG